MDSDLSDSDHGDADGNGGAGGGSGDESGSDDSVGGFYATRYALNCCLRNNIRAHIETRNVAFLLWLDVRVIISCPLMFSLQQA